MGLEEYKKKRDFKKTPEPVKSKKGSQNIFVIQRHEARRLHYDFRLEIGGVLKSWAVPKGVPVSEGERRLAIETEDHPIAYADFAGRIPKGEYGAGSVEIWDRGTIENLGHESLDKSYESGKIEVLLKGNKLNESFALIKTKGMQKNKNSWILLKMKEKNIDISNPQKELFGSGITKDDYVRYYEKISYLVLPHLKDRMLVQERFPNGVFSDKFYQKNSPDFYPEWIERKKIESNNSSIYYPICNDKKTLLYIVSQVAVLHGWLSKKQNPKYPDKMVFDLDPPENHIETIKESAKGLLYILEKIGMRGFLMTTGSKGLHIVTPLDEKSEFKEVFEFASEIADFLQYHSPNNLTTEFSKSKREGRVFIDYYRNAFAQTSVIPYSVRAIEGAPIASPISEKELEQFHPRMYNISNISKRKEDPWKDFFKKKYSVKDAKKRFYELTR